MPREFINPNWHVILVHYPIGLITLGLVVEVLGLLWPRRGFRAAGRWMILLGALAAIPTAMAGLYAFRDVVAPASRGVGGHRWVDVKAQSPWSAEQWEFLDHHVWYNGSAAVVLLLVVVLWVAGSDRFRRRAYVPLLLFAIGAVVLMGMGAFHGGELVYRFGTGVTADSGPPALASAGAGAASLNHRLRYYVPPLQLHVVLAGFAMAAYVLSLALMVRRWHEAATPVVVVETDDVPATSPPAAPRRPINSEIERTGDDVVVVTDAPGTVTPLTAAELAGPGGGRLARVGPPRARPGRFWLLGALVALAAAVAGLWSVLGVLTPEGLRRNLDTLKAPDHRRLLMHVAAGLGLVVVPLILAPLVRAGRKLRAGQGLLAAVVVLLAAAQLWLGILLLFDSHAGPLTGFNPPGASTAHSHDEDRHHDDGATPAATQAATAAGDIAVVAMTDEMEFKPARVTVRAGQTVEWKNASDMAHTVTADPAKAEDKSHAALPAGAEAFDSGDVAPGRTYRRTFTVPGHYKYFCTPHESAGMVGEVRVEPAQ